MRCECLPRQLAWHPFRLFLCCPSGPRMQRKPTAMLVRQTVHGPSPVPSASASSRPLGRLAGSMWVWLMGSTVSLLSDLSQWPVLEVKALGERSSSDLPGMSPAPPRCPTGCAWLLVCVRQAPLRRKCRRSSQLFIPKPGSRAAAPALDTGPPFSCPLVLCRCNFPSFGPLDDFYLWRAVSSGYSTTCLIRKSPLPALLSTSHRPPSHG